MLVNVESFPEKFIFILLSSVIFGVCMKFLYERYYRSDEPVDGSIGRSFPLMAPAVASIFWLIQSSLPLSLGLLGSLSFIRFRSPVKRAEDITFILITIAGALACAVGQFFTVFLLLVAVAAYETVRNRARWLQSNGPRFAVLTFRTKTTVDVSSVTQRVKKSAPSLTLMSTSTEGDTCTFVFRSAQMTDKNQQEVLTSLKVLDASARIDVFFPDHPSTSVF